jgi:hypothetical protein
MDRLSIPPTPELDKRNKILHSNAHPQDTLTDFWDWMEGQGWHVCELVVRNPEVSDTREFVPVRERVESMFERFFGLDGAKMEQEKRAILAHLREQQG